MTDTPNPQQTLQARAQALLNDLWGDNELGPAIRRAAKKKFPDITIPEDNTDPVIAKMREESDTQKKELKSLIDKLAERDKADNDKAAEADMSKRLGEARTKFALSDDGYQKMLERMKATANFTDAEAAAAWVVSQNPKPAPHNDPTWLPKSMNLFGSHDREEQFEQLHKNPQKYVDDQLREFARDPEKYTKETFTQATA